MRILLGAILMLVVSPFAAAANCVGECDGGDYNKIRIVHGTTGNPGCPEREEMLVVESRYLPTSMTICDAYSYGCNG